MTDVRNFLFDFGNVIIDLDIDGATERIRALMDPDQNGPDVEQSILTAIEKFETGAISREVFLNALLRHARPGTQALDVIRAWNSMLVGIPVYRLGMLEKLKSTYGVYLLSNTNELHLEWVYRHLDRELNIDHFDGRFFDATYYSHLIGHRKPDRSCYTYVIRESMITPEKTLFIDDNPENIEAAAQLGFRTHLSPAGEEIAEVLRRKKYF